MIFLTGATGLLGAHLSRHLLAAGYAVKALRRPDSDLSVLEDIAHQMEWVEGDLLDISLLQKALQGCKQVVHCAGMVSFAPKDADLLYTTNVEGTKSLVDAALEAGIERFIHISSVAAIGRPKLKGLIDEEQKWEKSAFNSWYGETKYLGELEVWRGHTEGMPSIIFNPAVVLGPGPTHRSSTQLFKYVLEQHPFYPAGLVNWVDVRDVAELVMAALQPTALTGERYIISAGAVRYQELFNRIAACLKVQSPQFQANSFLSRGAYYLEKIQGLFGKKRPMVTKETLLLSKTEIEFDNSKITKHYNFTFRSLEDTIHWCCQELTAHLL